MPKGLAHAKFSFKKILNKNTKTQINIRPGGAGMKGYLVLQNGEKFEGKLEGKQITNVDGEVVFFTGMTGYQEVITDPSFKGQIVVFTYPLIGNYGINEEDFESKKPQVSAIIVCQLSDKGHHYQVEHTLKEYCEKWNIPILSRVDTRAVVKRIRTEGMMGGMVSSDSNVAAIDAYKAIETRQLVKDVSVSEIETYGNGQHHIVLIDFGYKKSIVKSLLTENCKVTVVPYNTEFSKVHALKPDGILLSNGPGDPKQLKDQLPTIKKLAETYPTLAICLGHQLLSLAFGGNTKKLKFGHRGANQPVIDLIHKKVFMSSQNHSFVVDDESLNKTPFSIRYRNVNDGSVEGMTHPNLPIFSVQFHPEANPGPADSSWIFSEYITTLNSTRGEKVYA